MHAPADDSTTSGGKQGFSATHWSVILGVDAADPQQERELLNAIIARYWKPVYCYVRRKGFDRETAKDRTQGFFTTVVLGRGLVQKAEPAAGRFRTLLLTALDRYLIDEHTYQTRQKRMPADGLLPLDVIDWQQAPESPSDVSPDHAFAYAWAKDLIAGALAEVQASYRHKGMATHWELFRGKVLASCLGGEKTPSYADLAQAHGLDGPQQAANMVATVVRGIRSAIRAELRQWVNSDEEIDEEIGELMSVLVHGGA